MRKPKAVLVEESIDGVYVWRMPNGKWVGDSDGNFLSIAAKKGDAERVRQLRDAVRHYGIIEGAPKFLSGNRKIDDEEFEHQKARAAAGLIPDPFDVGAMKEELQNRGIA